MLAGSSGANSFASVCSELFPTLRPLELLHGPHVKGQEQEDEKGMWPRTLSILHGVMTNHFKRRGMPVDKAVAEASSCINALSDYFGGRPVYIPVGARLKSALRSREIYQKHTGSNTHELAEEYGVTTRQVQKIVVREMELSRARRRNEQS